METVSIIIPVYNVAGYLEQCMDAVLAQTYDALEIILIDDGSTDGSGEICDRYGKRDPRVTVIHQPNAGAANAKNAGLDRASGAYITFLDSDDYVERTWIETLVRTAEEYTADVVECGFDKVYRTQRKIENRFPEKCIFSAEEYLRQYLNNWSCSLFWNKLFRSALLTDVRFRKERRCIDDEFFTYKAFKDAKIVVHIPDVLYHYRQRASSVVASGKNRFQIADDSLEIPVERYQWICRHFPRLREIYLLHDVEILFYFAECFDFTRAIRRKFRKTARYYLKESILTKSSKTVRWYALRLQTLQLKSKKDAAGAVAAEDYFA